MIYDDDGLRSWVASMHHTSYTILMIGGIHTSHHLVSVAVLSAPVRWDVYMFYEDVADDGNDDDCGGGDDDDVVMVWW